MTNNRVLVALLNADQEFQQLQAADARAAATRLGLSAEIVFAEGHAVVQIQQLFSHVHAEPASRPDAILVESVTGEGLQRVARNAAGAGIGWILLNTRVPYIEELRKAYPALPFSLVSGNQTEVGCIQARQCLTLLPGLSRVLVIQGPADTTVASERLAGLERELGPRGVSCKVIDGTWTEQSAEKSVTSWLRLKTADAFRPAAVLCQNDSMAVGARRAILSARPDWTDIPFLGCDGLPDGGQRLVRQGDLAATVVIPSNTGPALELLSAYFTKGRMPPHEVLLSPVSYPPEKELARRSPADR